MGVVDDLDRLGAVDGFAVERVLVEPLALGGFVDAVPLAELTDPPREQAFHVGDGCEGGG